MTSDPKAPHPPHDVSEALPHSLGFPAARWAHPGSVLPPCSRRAGAGCAQRDVRSGTRTGGSGHLPGDGWAVSGAVTALRVARGGGPSGPALGRPSPTAPLPRQHNRLLRLKPDTGASCPAAGLEPRAARREARSGLRLEAAPAPGCGVAWPGHSAAAGGGAVLRSEGSGDPSRRVAPARLQGRPQQLLCPCSAPTGPNRLKPAQAGSASVFSSILPPPPPSLPPSPWPPSRRHCKLVLPCGFPTARHGPPPLLCACGAAAAPESVCVLFLPWLPYPISFSSTVREVLSVLNIWGFSLREEISRTSFAVFGESCLAAGTWLYFGCSLSLVPP